MTPRRALRFPPSGRADAAALALAVLLGAAASAPSLLLRTRPGWAKCRDEALAPVPGTVEPDPGVAVGPAVAAAEAARPLVVHSAFRPDPTRSLGPPPAPLPAAGAARTADLGGRVADGRLTIRWTPAQGARGTILRVEGLGGPGIFEQEFPADRRSVEIPVPGASGTIVIRATPAGVPGPVAEARAAVPFRVPVEIVRVERASVETRGAILVLRRSYDGRPVEASFALHEADPVGGLSSAAPGGPVVDFRTLFVLEEIRAREPGGPPVEVPEFGSDGHVLRDAAGRPLTTSRSPEGAGSQEVVLRGPDDERRILRTP